MSQTVPGTIFSLADSLEWLSALHERFEVRAGQPSRADWIAASDLMHPASERLDQLLEVVGTMYATPDRQIRVSFFMNSYAWLLASASLGCYVVSGRVPDLAPSNLWVRFEATGRATGISFTNGKYWALPDDIAAEHPDAIVVRDKAELRAILRRQIEAHMRVLIPVLRTKSSFGTRGLWVTVADRCAGFLFWLHQHHPNMLERKQLLREVEGLIRVPESPFNNPLTSIQRLSDSTEDNLALQRGACCLNYKRPDGKYCASCPLCRSCKR